MEENKQKPESYYSRLPKSLTTVTTFSKLVALLLFILLPFVGFLLGANYQAKLDSLKSQNSAIIPSISPTPTGISADTTSWITYTNPKYGYSIKHPPSWHEEVKCRGGLPGDDYICFKSPDFKESPAPNTESGGLIIIENNKMGSYWTADTIETFCTRPQVSKCVNISVGELSAKERELSGWLFKDVGIIKNGDFVMSIRVDYATDSKGVILETFDQILSTFTFAPLSTSKFTPTPTCVPRPACLDATPRCMIAESENMCPPGSNSKYTCPTTEYVDCMPGPSDKMQPAECQTDYLSWAQKNCPGFKGAAL